jgi:subfamily B ATP-binding cassette protein MsbA
MPNAKTLTGLNNSIKFENVNFEYIPEHPVLKNLTLTVNKNESLAIVGNSGGGKSTLVNLLPRFYDIKSGSIMIDDTDIREFTLSSLRKNISMVFQDNFLFSGTIRENIMMGNEAATEEELNLAIESAHLQDVIDELPEGIDTIIGERGTTLSGGQRQRVAIARAMLRNAPIVILDEATSALDNESEAIVQKAMDNLMVNRTVFIIAHRLSTIKNADRIAVINEGELVELGTHNELMSIENGDYRTLYEMQFKHQEEAGVNI